MWPLAFGAVVISLGAWSLFRPDNIFVMSVAILLLGAAISLTGIAETPLSLPPGATVSLRALALMLYVLAVAALAPVLFQEGSLSSDARLVAVYTIIALMYGRILLGHNRRRRDVTITDEFRPAPLRRSSGPPSPEERPPREDR